MRGNLKKKMNTTTESALEKQVFLWGYNMEMEIFQIKTVTISY